MLARPSKKKLIAFISPLLIFAFFVSISYHDPSQNEQQLARRLDDDEPLANENGLLEPQAALNLLAEDDDINSDNDSNDDGNDPDELIEVQPMPDSPDYREIFSLTTNDGKYFPIYLGEESAYNPTIIPHPTRYDMWIIVAQHEQSREQIVNSGELTCIAGFFNGVLVCAEPPTILPIEPSIQGVCEGDLAYFNFRSGPRDARMFYGPDTPYIIYGSQSAYSCLGIWLQDVRMLLRDFHLESLTIAKLFKRATEIQRPPPHQNFEKNFFLFWDSEGKAYIHHDIWPKRVFAELSQDGSVGPDLAPLAANKDDVCMAKYMPTVRPHHEDIHQATNSLSITMCERSDPTCIPSDSNTFILNIFHHKSYYDFHGVYEPYVMLFHRNAPFTMHSVSQRPLWIHGRKSLTKATGSLQFENIPEEKMPKNHSELFYITGMSWRGHGQKYHGYLDDVIFLTFGIEDSRPAAIDVLASDLLQDMALCAH